MSKKPSPSEMQELVDEASDKVVDAEEVVKALKDELAESEIQAQEKELEDKRLELTNLKERKLAKEGQLNELQEKVKVNSELDKTIDKKLKDLESEHQKQDGKRKSSLKEIEDLKDEIASSNSEGSEDEEEIAGIAEELNSLLKQELDNQNAELAKLHKAADVTEKLIATRKEEKKASDLRIAESIASIVKITGELQTLNPQIQKAETEIEDLENKLRISQANIESLKEELEAA